VTRAGLVVTLGLLYMGWVNAQPTDEPFASKDGKFTVRFPGKPKETTTTPKSPLGELKVHTATYATAEANVFMASFTDFPDGTGKPETRDTLYEGVREGLKGKDGVAVNDKEIEVGREKLPGREFDVTQGKQKMRFRVVLRGDRLYQVAVIGTQAFVESKEATGFLDSFTLTK
jgi:hypothetical protein